MSIWQLLKKWRMGSQQKKIYHLILGEPLTFKDFHTATQESNKSNFDSQAVSPPDHKQIELYEQWIHLSPRQQDLVAFACLDYTNNQIAARLGIGLLTVKKYYQAVFQRLNVKSKTDIRIKFIAWDFSAWERRQHQR